jgi:hypothetical protein
MLRLRVIRPAGYTPGGVEGLGEPVARDAEGDELGVIPAGYTPGGAAVVMLLPCLSETVNTANLLMPPEALLRLT